MNIPDTITQELAALNSTLPIVKQPVFTVPNDYFENFSLTVLQRVQAAEHVKGSDIVEESSFLSGFSREMPYAVPENYFSSLAGATTGLIIEPDLPLVLQQLTKSNPLTVPAGYFETLSQNITQKVGSGQKAKIISLGRSSLLRVAAAVAVIGFISLFYFTGQNSANPVLGSDSWVATSLSGVSDKALEDFVNGAEIVSFRPKAPTAAAAAEVRKLLKDVSDGELEDFLSAVPSDDEELILIN